MRILIVSDLHFRSEENFGNNTLVNNISINSRTIDKIKKLIGIIKEEKPDVLIDAGDLYDSPVPAEYVRTIYFSNIPKLVNQLFLVSGNHSSSKGLATGSSEAKVNKNISVINPAQVLKFQNITMIGYTRDNEEFLRLCNDNSNTFLISHRDPEPNSNFKTCFYGHYHEPKKVGNSYSIGSLFKQNFSEELFENRYLVIEDEKFEFKTFKDIEIKTFNKLEDFEEGIYTAVRYKFKDKAQVINSINKQEIRERYSNTFVSFDLDIETNDYSNAEQEVISEDIEELLKDKKLTKEELEFGKKVLENV